MSAGLVLVGAWLVLAPWTLGYGVEAAAFWNDVAVAAAVNDGACGLLVIVLAGADRRPRQAAAPDSADVP